MDLSWGGGAAVSGGFAVDLDILENVRYLLSCLNQYSFDDATSSLHVSSLPGRLSVGTAFGPADDLVGVVADLARAYGYSLEVLQYVLAQLEAQIRTLEARTGETIQAYDDLETRLESSLRHSSRDQ